MPKLKHSRAVNWVIATISPRYEVFDIIDNLFFFKRKVRRVLVQATLFRYKDALLIMGLFLVLQTIVNLNCANSLH